LSAAGQLFIGLSGTGGYADSIELLYIICVSANLFLSSMNINKVTLAGRLTRDPEIKYTASGTAIADFSLAVNRYYKNNAGESQEQTDFIDCTAFGRSAEIIQKFLKKGNPIYVEGRLSLDQWQDKQSGQPRSKLRVVAESMQFVGPRPQTQAAAGVPSPDRRPGPAASAPAGKRPLDPDLDAAPTDIPF
jgi:single-strand DNA-binding protein